MSYKKLNTTEDFCQEPEEDQQLPCDSEGMATTTTLKVENQNLTSENLENIKWSETSIPLSDFVNTYPLPQIVQIEEGYHDGSDENSLSMGQVLKIHTLTTERKLLCDDRHDKELTIPVHTQKVQLKPPNYDTVYQRVSDLAHVKPLPSYVEVTRGYYNVDSNIDYELSVDPGETLEVVDVVESGIFSKKNNRSMNFRNSEGVTLKLPYDCVAGFKPLVDNTPHMLADVLPSDMNSYTFPFHFQFEDKSALKMGVLKAKSSYNDKLIIASCGQGNAQVVFMISQNLKVKVKVAVGTLKDDPEYQSVIKKYHNFKFLETDLQKTYSFRRRGLQSSQSEVYGIQIPMENGDANGTNYWETFDENNDGPMVNGDQKVRTTQSPVSTCSCRKGSLIPVIKINTIEKTTQTEVVDRQSIGVETDKNLVPSQTDPLGEIKAMSVNELAEELQQLKMSKHTEEFVENQVDGALFCELTDDEFKDLGLNNFEIKKLIRFKNGWRPKLS